MSRRECPDNRTADRSDTVSGYGDGGGAFPPLVRCVCGCLGAAHRTVWSGGDFGGTVCHVGEHGGHKFQPEPDDPYERFGPQRWNPRAG